MCSLRALAGIAVFRRTDASRLAPASLPSFPGADRTWAHRSPVHDPAPRAGRVLVTDFRSVTRRGTHRLAMIPPFGGPTRFGTTGARRRCEKEHVLAVGPQ